MSGQQNSGVSGSDGYFYVLMGFTNTRKGNGKTWKQAWSRGFWVYVSHNYGRPRITGCLNESMTNNDTCLVRAAIMKCVFVLGGD